MLLAKSFALMILWNSNHRQIANDYRIEPMTLPHLLDLLDSFLDPKFEAYSSNDPYYDD